ncbi:MAG: YciI family protein [Marinoscillum sp.]
MKKFLVIYHAPQSVVEQMAQATPEQRAESMKPWMEWKEALGDKMLDLGAPLFGGQKLNPNGSVAPSQKEVTGYSMIQAGDMEEAKSLLEGHPHLAAGGCEIEVHEAMAM